MQRSTTHTAQASDPSATRRFSEQPENDRAAGDAMLHFEGSIGVANEADDAGADPYNRTGRFRRVVR